MCLLVEPSLFEKTELGDFQAINDPKTTLSELEKLAQERIYLKLVHVTKFFLLKVFLKYEYL